jgi:hypothetical protein
MDRGRAIFSAFLLHFTRIFVPLRNQNKRDEHDAKTVSAIVVRCRFGKRERRPPDGVRL